MLWAGRYQRADRPSRGLPSNLPPVLTPRVLTPRILERVPAPSACAVWQTGATDEERSCAVMAIPDEKIEEIRASADLVDVAGDYVKMKRSGKRYMGLCPFHNESTPSFSVDPEQNLFYCFGCQKGGDVFKFIQEMEGVGFLESVRMLAERYGIPLPE